MYILDVSAYNSWVLSNLNIQIELKNKLRLRRRSIENLAKNFITPLAQYRADQASEKGQSFAKNIINSMRNININIRSKTLPEKSGLKPKRCEYCVQKSGASKQNNFCDICEKAVCKQHAFMTKKTICQICSSDYQD